MTHPILNRTIPLKRRAALAGLLFEHYADQEEIVCRFTDAAGKTHYFDNTHDAEQHLADLAKAFAASGDWFEFALHGWPAAPQKHQPAAVAPLALMTGRYVAQTGGAQ